jgi:hypothetical protein
MKIVFYDFKNQLTLKEIENLIDTRVLELRAQEFSEEQIFQIVFGSKKFRGSFLEPKYFKKTIDYFLTKHFSKKIRNEQ